jgi:hypothetical protein
MADLTGDIASQVTEVCRSGAAEAAAALGRAFDRQIDLSVGDLGSVESSRIVASLTGPGLAVVLVVGGQAALVLVPETSGLLPPWCPAPDATGRSKLTTLAQELGMVLLPEEVMPEDFQAGYVPGLADALRRGGVEAASPAIPLLLRAAGGAEATAWLVWPAGRSAAVLEPAAPPPIAVAPPPPPRPARRRAQRLEDLPNYTRSLLRVRVPLVVTLARKRQAAGRIVE